MEKHDARTILGRRGKRSGTSLIEAMISMAIFAITFIGTIQMTTMQRQMRAVNSERAYAGRVSPSRADADRPRYHSRASSLKIS